MSPPHPIALLRRLFGSSPARAEAAKTSQALSRRELGRLTGLALLAVGCSSKGGSSAALVAPPAESAVGFALEAIPAQGVGPVMVLDKNSLAEVFAVEGYNCRQGMPRKDLYGGETFALVDIVLI